MSWDLNAINRLHNRKDVFSRRDFIFLSFYDDNYLCPIEDSFVLVIFSETFGAQQQSCSTYLFAGIVSEAWSCFIGYTFIKIYSTGLELVCIFVRGFTTNLPFYITKWQGYVLRNTTSDYANIVFLYELDVCALIYQYYLIVSP